MADRTLLLSSRNEETRDKRTIQAVVQFSLIDIKKHFDESILSIEKKFEAVDVLKNAGNTVDAKDVLRSQIVFLESAFDFYLHEISKYALISIFNGKWSKTEKYNNYMIPMRYVETGLQNPESSEWLLDYINERMGREVYLSVDIMKEQLNLLGINFNPVLETAFPDPKAANSQSKGRTIIRSLFERRNCIAHQSDRSHANAEQNDISVEYVKQCIRDVKSIVSAIHQKAVEKSE